MKIQATIENTNATCAVSFEKARSTPGIYLRKRESEHYYKYLITDNDKNNFIMRDDGTFAVLRQDDDSGEGDKFVPLTGTRITVTFSAYTSNI